MKDKKFITVCYLFAIAVLVNGCSSKIGKDRVDIPKKTNQIASANLKLATAYFENGQYEKSLEKLKRALEADKRYSPTHNMLGLLYQRLDQPALAGRYFEESVRLDPYNSQSLNNYGQFLCQLGKYEEAEKAFMKALENPLYEKPEIAYTNAAFCAQKSDDYRKAITYYRKALEFQPKMPLALINMAKLSFEADNFLSARAYIQRYMELVTHSPQTLWLAIRVEKKLGDEDALSSYGLLLRNKFSDSEEAKLYGEMLVNE